MSSVELLMASFRSSWFRGHALRGVGATGELLAARCAYDFVRPRTELDAEAVRLLRGGITKVVRGILYSRVVALFYLLDVLLRGQRRHGAESREVFACWRKVSMPCAIAAGFS